MHSYHYESSVRAFWAENKFLDCAPPTLVESLHNSSDQEYEVLVKFNEISSLLCKSPEMKKPWTEFKKKFDYYFMFDRFAEDLVGAIYSALYQRSGWDELTPTEKKDKKTGIVKQLNDLSKLLERYPTDINIFSVLTGDELKMLFQGEENHRLIHDGFYPYNILGVPKLSDFLGRIALKLDASEPPSSHTSHTKKDKEKLLHKRFFRELESFFRERLNTPSYSTLAVLGNLFIPGNAFDKDSVRALVQDRRKKT